jgi:hypothetical protein
LIEQNKNTYVQYTVKVINFTFLKLLKMNFGAAAEKLEEIPKEEWLDRLQGVQVTRGDMNKLIMNYLVTGMQCECRYFGKIIFCQISTSFGRIIFSRKFIGLMEMCRHGGWQKMEDN